MTYPRAAWILANPKPQSLRRSGANAGRKQLKTSVNLAISAPLSIRETFKNSNICHFAPPFLMGQNR